MSPVKTSAIFGVGQLSIFVKIMTLIFALNLVIERGLQLIPIYTLGGNFNWQNTLMTSLKLPFFWTGLLVPITYLFALWGAANFLRGFERSKSFNGDLLKSLQTIGANLMYAAMAAILLVPTIEAWINQGSRDLKTAWDVEAVTIGMIGLILKYVAQRAQSLQGEVDSFV
ncbi:hypothetical protein H8K52_01530 [Undibacterium seohonense]|uniref:DUF2975 domain-containing protein n=1 Tax=Undibacterium seohonense TaxID=1344950 RepID=A0ABR6X047_9BURK|nr:DUF2975 domain-containing protein [Undibacterium seohonense]MBC3806023.1 hypothetical protein [Undibacterium seohonense]